jgi:hypothetical protein
MSVFKANTMQQMSFVLRRGLGYSKRRQEKLEWKRRERHKKEERKGKGKEAKGGRKTFTIREMARINSQLVNKYGSRGIIKYSSQKKSEIRRPSLHKWKKSWVACSRTLR